MKLFLIIIGCYLGAGALLTPFAAMLMGRARRIRLEELRQIRKIRRLSQHEADTFSV